MGYPLVLALAVVQGLTEFLPVSSSGHLRLLAAASGLEAPQTLLDVMLHVGTLAAVVFFYRADVGRIIASLLRSAARLARGRTAGLLRDEPDTRLALLLVAATIPAGLVGGLLGSLLERHIATPLTVGCLLLLNGGVLMLGGRTRVGRGDTSGRPLSEMGLRDAMIIGVAQSFALLRGISRSGSTISAALLLGYRRDDAARFSFLLSIPAIVGASVLELRHVGQSGAPPALLLVTGALAAAVVGWAALVLLLRVVRAGRFDRFAWYCWLVGGGAVVASLTGIL